MKLLLGFGFIGLMTVKWVDGFENANVTNMQYAKGRDFCGRHLLVDLNLMNGAAAQGAGIHSVLPI